MSESEKTIIELDDTDAALVLQENGIGFYIQKDLNGDAEVSINALIVTVLGILLKNGDVDLINLIENKLEELMKGDIENEKD